MIRDCSHSSYSLETPSFQSMPRVSKSRLVAQAFISCGFVFFSSTYRANFQRVFRETSVKSSDTTCLVNEIGQVLFTPKEQPFVDFGPLVKQECLLAKAILNSHDPVAIKKLIKKNRKSIDVCRVTKFFIKNKPSYLIYFFSSLFNLLEREKQKEIQVLLEKHCLDSIAKKEMEEAELDIKMPLNFPEFWRSTKKYKLEDFENNPKYLFKVAKNNSDLCLVVMFYKKINNKDLFFEELFKLSFKEILEIAEAIAEKFFMQRFAIFTERKYTQGPFDTIFIYAFDPSNEHVKTLERGIELGLPISPSLIKSVCISQNYAFLAFILDKLGKEGIRDHTRIILSTLARIQDEKVAALILEKAPNIKEDWMKKYYWHIDFFHFVLDNNTWFLEWFLKDISLNIFQQSTFLDLVYQNYNLRFIRKFSAKPLYYSQILGENPLNREALLLTVSKYALMSPLDEVYEMAKKNPLVAQVLPEVLARTAVVVRFPRISCAFEIGNYQENKVYIEETSKYATENISFIEEIKALFPRITREALLEEIVKNRYQRLNTSSMERDKKKSPYYKKKARYKGYSSTAWTLLRQTTLEEEKGEIFQNLIRYSYSWKHLSNRQFDWKKKRWKEIIDSSSLKKKEGSVWDARKNKYVKVIDIDFLYSDPEDFIQPVLVTTINNLGWSHFSPYEVLKDHLETLHKQIIDFPLDYANLESKKAFFEKVARAYWLLATLCEFERGTPHNAMMWLNLVYSHHHLPPPIPTQDHFFLDNTMLMIPFETAIEQWESFFEPLLDETVLQGSKEKLFQEKDLEALFRENGMLLQLCSATVRDNEHLVKIALQQNEKASLFASERIRIKLHFNNLK